MVQYYNATTKTNRTLKKGNIYLVDSVTVPLGTTDVTRQFLETKIEKLKKLTEF